MLVCSELSDVCSLSAVVITCFVAAPLPLPGVHRIRLILKHILQQYDLATRNFPIIFKIVYNIMLGVVTLCLRCVI